MELDPALEERILRRVAKKPVTFRLDLEQIRSAKEIAQRRSLAYQSLLRMWIVEGIERERAISSASRAIGLQETRVPYAFEGSSLTSDVPEGVLTLTSHHKILVSHAGQPTQAHERFFRLMGTIHGYTCRWGSLAGTGESGEIHGGDSDRFLSDLDEADCLIALAEVFLQSPKPVTRQMALALQLGKPVLAMVPMMGGAVPEAIRKVAVEILPWNARAIFAAVERWTGGVS